MKAKKIVSFVFAVVLVCSLSVCAFADDAQITTAPGTPVKAMPAAMTIAVDGSAVDVEAYVINDYTYFKLRDVAAMVAGTDAKFGVEYIDETSTVVIDTASDYAGKLIAGTTSYDTALPTRQAVTLDGAALDLNAYNIGGYNYFKLRDLGRALDFGVDYEEASKTVKIATAEDYTYSTDLAKAIASGEYTWVKSDDGTYYTLENVVYCTDPVNVFYDSSAHLYESMIIIAPAEYFNGGTVNGYTADTAPIVLKNNCQGWNSSIPQTRNDDSVITYLDQIKAGFIYVGCGARSRNLVEGNAPAPVVDLKAGIRFLKLNDAVIPGDSGKIVSMGGSGAGEMSSVLGASGNMEEYYSYLYEIGAAGIEFANGKYVSTIGDDVYGCMAFYPIADINNADMAYAWLRYDTGETKIRNWRTGATIEFSEFQLTLQNDLAVAFCEYVNSLGLKDENGNALTFDTDASGAIISPRQGSYYDRTLQNLTDTLALYLAELDDPDAFIAENYYVDGALPAWLTKDNTGYHVTDIADFLKGTELGRNKDITGFDHFELTAENNAFGAEDEAAVHYSASVAAVLKKNYDKYSAMAGFNAEQTDLYIAQAVRSDIVEQAYLMNATHIMFDVAAGTQKADVSDNWRIRVGTADQHTSFSVGYNMALSAAAAGAKVDCSLVWNMVHGSEKEGTSTGTFIDWVNSICK